MSGPAATDPFAPLSIGPLGLRNRFIKSATNEGMAPAGVPSRMLVEHHRRIAAGGAALTTVAYCAVSEDGRTFPDQVCLDQQTLPHLRVLTDAVHRAGGSISAQITHGGAFNFLPALGSGNPLSASGGFNPVGLMTGRPCKQAMTEGDMAQIAGEFVRAARLAEQAGFDAVEIHMGHGYLLSQFLSPLYNKRRDQYGGGAAQRVRFPVRVLEQVLAAVGQRLAVICKFSMDEGVRRGAHVEDSIEVARALERAGAHLLVLSAGMNVESPWAIFGSTLPAEVSDTVANPLMRWAARLARLREPRIEFRPLFLLDNARRIRAAVRMPLAYLGGVQSLAGAQRALADGFEFLALGRALIHDPQFINKLRDGQVAESGCTACNQCIVQMYTPGGTACVLGPLNDPAMNRQPAADHSAGAFG